MSAFKGIGKVRSRKRATNKQLEYIDALCSRLGDDTYLENADKLTVGEASELIEKLKAELDAALDEDADNWDDFGRCY